MMQWFKIAESLGAINWQPNSLAIVEVGGRTITLAKLKDRVYACAHKCPHAGGIMANGFFDLSGNIICPLHSYKFSLQNGRNTSGEGYHLKTFIIEEREEGTFVCFDEK